MKQDYTIDSVTIDSTMLATLPTFRAVATCGSFTEAAGRLGVTPSPVSQAIRQLELRLGIGLFQRNSRSVRLTDDGARLLSEAADALDRPEGVVDALRSDRDLPAGRLRITLSRLAAEICVMPRFAEFVQTWPDIQLELFIDDRFNDVVAGGFDAGIRLGISIDKDMVARPIGPRLRRSLIASPDYFERHGIPRRLEDLARHRALRFQFPGSGQLEPWRFRRNGAEVDDVTRARAGADGQRPFPPGGAGRPRPRTAVQGNGKRASGRRSAGQRAGQPGTTATAVPPVLAVPGATAKQGPNVHRVLLRLISAACRHHPGAAHHV